MILLDTCAIIWRELDPAELSQKAKNAILKAEKEQEIIISSISFLEIAMLARKKRLVVPISAEHFMHLILFARGYGVKEITPEIAALSISLPEEINEDPVDRIIAATTLIENAKMITKDKNLLSSKLVPTIW